MVQVAIAGASSEVAQEVVDVLLRRQHNVILLARKSGSFQKIKYVKTDYEDIDELARVLTGVEVVLSFITTQTDLHNISQKNIILACLKAGVRRFAPSEWASSGLDSMPWYSGKLAIRHYLEELNRTELKLEYTLFQPGLFTNYLTYPHQTAKYVHSFATQFDFENCRAIVPEKEDVSITMTTARDMAEIVSRAVEYKGQWPVTGGICGSEINVHDLVRFGAKLRGQEFSVEYLKSSDLKSGVTTSTWTPVAAHPAIPADQAAQMARDFLCGLSLAMANGEFKSSNEWNQLLPEYTMASAESFLESFWRDR